MNAVLVCGGLSVNLRVCCPIFLSPLVKVYGVYQNIMKFNEISIF